MRYEELTGKIIRCAMNVHSELGNGFQEVVYQRALAIEFQEHGLEFIREQEMDVYYKKHKIASRRVDFFIERSIMIELKAITKLEPVHLAQSMNYLEAHGLQIGLLINFGTSSLEFKRIHNNKLIFPPRNTRQQEIKKIL